MITSLHISNYALIEEIDIEFDSSLNIITGETGAGKSIILGALSLILGGRADLKTVRDSSRKTIVEAVFDISRHRHLDKVFNDADIDSLEDTCILRRELTTKGGSRAFINDTPVTLPLLREVSLQLLDIHSQHQNLKLTDPAYQLSLIDALAGNSALLDDYHKAYETYRKALKKFTATRDMLNRNKSEAEYLSFQLEQLDDLNLKDGEQTQLEHDRDVLSNMTDIKSGIVDAIDAIDTTTDVSASLSTAIESLREVSDYYDSADELADRLNSARIEIMDVLDTLNDYNATLQADPRELEEIENRLGEIYSLETKHHVDTDSELIALHQRLREQLNAIENADDTLAELEHEAKKAKKTAVLIARDLSSRRAEFAVTFSNELKERAMPLGLNNIRCEIVLSQGKLGPDGMDNIEFMFSFNRNQPLMPVGKTASGGEISRVILAIKSIVVEKMNLPTIIFDEVDTGVSGDTANRMGLMMTDISDHAQVITITHLPQIAARGNRHFKVYKHDNEDATVTDIKILGDTEREGELAVMLSGSSTDATALAAARSLLKHRPDNK